ncbi:MAG: hypothetical protein P3W87_001170, partial [Gammaproteobacteria bacterium]|nr:hypothetical protein [Gammaproteobacteria bacterium]
AVHDMAQGREAKEALQDLLRHIDPESPLLTERVTQKARALSMEAFQKQQQERRQQRVALQEASLMAPMKDFAAQAAEQLASEVDAKPQA